jgi:uncharacterized membrane-anchored protein YjiN (DUF445 family)
MQATNTTIDGAEDADKLRALRRTKFVATASLVLCIAVFLAARALEPRFPGMAFVAAFAEAAAIGGLADWYAVVALFRRPLGLPIPHTAIIPANRDRIASNLGSFIERNFLSASAVETKLREVDFAAQVADWLTGRERAAALAAFVARLAPQALAGIEKSSASAVVMRRMRARLDEIDIAPAAAQLLSAFTAERRHQQLFDQFLRVFGRILSDEEALTAIRDRIREELPTLARVFRADAYLLKKIVASAATLIEEVEADADHPLRAEFDRFVLEFLERMRTSPDYARRAEAFKQELLSRPELRNIANDFWASLKKFIEDDVAGDDSVIRRQLTDMLVAAGRQLRDDEALRTEMNGGFVVLLGSFVEAQKSGVSAFIADQVRRWDMIQLTRLIELNIGRDLQYIRFNGMAIGGIAGLLLHVLEISIF